MTDFEPPPRATLPGTLWRVRRETRSDSGEAKPLRRFEDAPFYARSLIGHRLLGEEVASVHESLDLDRFARQWVRVLLPFRMPRRSGP